MLNRFYTVTKQIICNSLLTACASTICISSCISSAASQVLPEAWVTVGSADDLVSYGAGVRFLGIGLEVGTGQKGATGADLLKFISLPIVSPYLGLGYYSGDENVAYSGGVHLNTGRHLVLGVGYHSLRGFNGQLGFRF